MFLLPIPPLVQNSLNHPPKTLGANSGLSSPNSSTTGRSRNRFNSQMLSLSCRNALKTQIEACIIKGRCYHRSNKNSLYAKISPQGNPSTDVTPELDKWVNTGKKLRFAELQRIIVDLRKRKRFSQALQVSEWMKSRDVYNFTPVQHAVQLDLIGKVHGFLRAESYFNSLSEQDKNDKVYGALLHCYVRQRETERAMTHFKTIKDKGLPLSSLAFNDIMTLYASIEEIDKVPEIFEEMKQHGIQPDNLSYRICINSFGVRSDIEGLEKVLNEMESDAHITMDWNTYTVVANYYVKADLKHKANNYLKKAEEMLDKKDAVGYNQLISLHARLGNRDDVLRLWYDEKIACKRRLNKEYINMMEALMRLDEVDEAEEVLKEWEASDNCYDFRVPNVVIDGCIEKGLCEKAEALLDHLTEIGKVLTPNVWGRLAREYIAKGKIENGLKSLKTALSLHDPIKERKLKDNVITGVVRLIGEKGSCDDAERAINLLRGVFPLERQMYHTLLKAYTARGEQVDGLIHIMRSDGYEEDEETLKILSLQQNVV